MINFIKNLSSTEILIIALILVVFFGAKAMGRMGKIGGETLREVKKIKKDFTEAVGDDVSKDNKGGV